MFKHQKNNSPKFIPVSEVARRLSLDRKTVLRYIHEGKIPAIKIGQYRIDEGRLQTAIQQFEVIK